MNLAKFQKNAISKEDQLKVIGGAGDVWDLIIDAWNATPEGGYGHWENQYDGSFDGFTIGPNDPFQWSTLCCYDF